MTPTQSSLQNHPAIVAQTLKPIFVQKLDPNLCRPEPQNETSSTSISTTEKIICWLTIITSQADSAIPHGQPMWFPGRSPRSPDQPQSPRLESRWSEVSSAPPMLRPEGSTMATMGMAWVGGIPQMADDADGSMLGRKSVSHKAH